MKHNYYLPMLLCALFFLTAYTAKTQILLHPVTQQQFVNPLPAPGVIDARNGGNFTITITQFQQDLGLKDPDKNTPLLTTVWGYNGTYPGPTILAKQNQAVDITWENGLISDGKPLPHILPVDASIHWALQNRDDWQTLGVPLVTHVHGGHTESASDGLPDAWYTPDFKVKGDGFVKKTLHYENDQEAATIWYHDHALGITRLNVYAGLAGFYLITDDREKQLQDNYQIPSAPYDVGLAIQDRMFTGDGQLYYPSLPESLGAPDTSVSPEFFGDFILVNGKTWPVLEVEPRPYRFRILNGSDSRFYNLYLSNGQSFFQIGSDNGLLPAPVNLKKILIGTGERRDVVIDFSGYENQTIVLHNNAKTPYPRGASVNPQTTGRIMAFKVTKALSNTPKTVLPASLRPAIDRLQTNLPPRKLILYESEDEFGRLKPMLGTVEQGIKNWHDPITENPMQGSTEIWEIYNETMDAHTMHLHMVHLQLISRQKFKASVDMETGKPSDIRLIGQPEPPAADEIGWKDTYVTNPGEVTRVIATFDLPGLYVWHCHILSHEDHEMMRPYFVTAAKTDKTDKTDKKDKTETNNNTAEVEQQLQLQTLPNPFSANVTVQLNLPQVSSVIISLYDSKGSRVQQVYNGKRAGGLQQFTIDGSQLGNGTYFCEIIVNNQRMVRKLVLQK